MENFCGLFSCFRRLQPEQNTTSNENQVDNLSISVSAGLTLPTPGEWWESDPEPQSGDQEPQGGKREERQNDKTTQWTEKTGEFK